MWERNKTKVENLNLEHENSIVKRLVNTKKSDLTTAQIELKTKLKEKFGSNIEMW